MEKVENKPEISLNKELYSQFEWFYRSFTPSVQKSADEFFSELFFIKLISISKNVNVLFQGDDYFVTKIRIDKQHDVFFRCSSGAVKIVLDRILGQTKKFNLSNITELEAKIISSFNDYIYGNIAKFMLSPPPKTQKRKNFDTIHLTFFIKEKDADEGAKIIISLPQTLLSPMIFKKLNENFDILNYKNTKIDVKLKIGTTSFSLKEIKNLEKEDIVIFENSDMHKMRVVYKDFEKDFRLNPNLGLITSISNDNGGDNMEDKSLSQSLWDNIQVEMGAEFEKVKITLGELKNIEQGLVVDISSVYNNKVSLTVENKVIAKGELVIINDRYGVRIDEVLASEKEPEEQPVAYASEEIQTEPHPDQEIGEETEGADDEFDYSDFEIDDEDI